MRNNIIANYAGKLWSFVSIYLFVPFYINILGVEAYGIINFYTVLLGLMMFADAGLSATMSREFAKSEQTVYLRNLLFSTERVYLVLVMMIVVAIGLFSGVISQTWMATNLYSVEELRWYVCLMGLAIAFQFYATLYSSGLMGLQEQVLVNIIQVIWSMVRSGGGVLVLYVSHNILYFLIWQVGCNLGYALYSRYRLWLSIQLQEKKIFDWKLLNDIRSFALGMMLMAIIASLNTQLDKLLVSKYLSLQQFGYYSIASTLSQLPLMVITPIVATVLPVLTKSVASGNQQQLQTRVSQYTYIITALASMIGLVLVMFPATITQLWTHNETVAHQTSGIIRVLSFGGIFLTMQYVPYLIALSNGHTRTNIVFGIGSVIVTAVLLTVFIHGFGVEGAAYPWLVVNTLVFFGMSSVLIRKFLPGFYGVWLMQSIVLPFIGSFVPVGVLFLLMGNPTNDLLFLLSVGILGMITLAFHYYIFKKLFLETVFNALT
jgi:O-antigen/teichoic acid export membrane protein